MLAILLLLRMDSAMFLVALGLYFLPTIIAAVYNHRYLVPIFAINFLVGWTIVGWFGVFLWSMSRRAPKAARR